MTPSQASTAAPRGLPVEVVRVTPRDLSRQVSVSAPVEALRHIEVASQIAGVITLLEVEAGDRVEKGAVLATLDVRETRAELARLAGYEDPEAWWEDVVELRMEGDPFDALTEDALRPAAQAAAAAQPAEA